MCTPFNQEISGWHQSPSCFVRKTWVTQASCKRKTNSFLVAQYYFVYLSRTLKKSQRRIVPTNYLSTYPANKITPCYRISLPEKRYWCDLAERDLFTKHWSLYSGKTVSESFSEIFNISIVVCCVWTLFDLWNRCFSVCGFKFTACLM